MASVGFWLDFIVPLLVTGIFSYIGANFLKKQNRQSLLWAWLFCGILFLVICGSYFLVSDVAADLRCMVDLLGSKGVVAPPPGVCQGMRASITLRSYMHLPIILVGWIVFSLVAANRIYPPRSI